MPFAILVLTLVAYGYVLIAYPDLRKPAGIAGAVAAAGLAVYFFVARPETIAIAPSELTLEEIALAQTVRGATVSGRVLNESERYHLREMTLSLTLRDCPEAVAAPETCPAIGEGTALVRPDVPAGQTRDFAAHFSIANVPPVLGTLRWDLSVAATRATDS